MANKVLQTECPQIGTEVARFIGVTMPEDRSTLKGRGYTLVATSGIAELLEARANGEIEDDDNVDRYLQALFR